MRNSEKLEGGETCPTFLINIKICFDFLATKFNLLVYT